MPHPLVLAPPSAITPVRAIRSTWTTRSPTPPGAGEAARRPGRRCGVTVDVGPARPDAGRAAALLATIARFNMALYRSPVTAEDKDLPRRLGAQLGLRRLDANWLADEDGISSITVGRGDGRRAQRLHPLHHAADPLAHRRLLPPGPAPHPRHAAALRAAGRQRRRQPPAGPRAGLHRAARRVTGAGAGLDAARCDDHSGPPDADGSVAREAQAGPVFSVEHGALHMRYTARTRSIEWHADPLVQQAATRLAALLGGPCPGC
jgi:hypothetical protein